jgi:hypothetical protein
MIQIIHFLIKKETESLYPMKSLHLLKHMTLGCATH